MATVKSFKAHVSSLNPSSERRKQTDYETPLEDIFPTMAAGLAEGEFIFYLQV